MKPIPFLVLGLSLSLFSAAPVLAGGKASGKHEQARAAKAEADLVAERKVKAKEEAARTGVKLPAEEKGWVWKPRPVRHKQTMPATPTLRESEKE